MPDEGPVQFDVVFGSEIDSINKRRPEGSKIALENEAFDGTRLTTSDGTTPLRPIEDSNVIGLALSGGGIRSAAFCLGALQALYKAGLLHRIDYMSTVSGGGYIGTSLSSGMTATKGHFPFASYLSEDELPSLQHVRDYSNYLFPRGAVDLLRNASVYARGLVINAVLILPFLLLGAAATILSSPLADKSSGANFIGIRIPNAFGLEHFIVSAYLALALLGIAIVWGICRSLPCFQETNEVPSWVMTWVGRLILLLLLVLFCEIQPFVLDAMFAQAKGGFLPSLVAWVKSVVLILAPVTAAIAFIAQKFDAYVKSALEF